MDKIFIRDLIARGIIGINDWERVNPQEIKINLVLYTDLIAAGESDDIEDSVNYRTISKKVLNHVENAKRLTVESLAADIARLCLENPRVVRVRVKVEKPGAVRFTKSVGVEIERGREFEQS